MLIYKAFYKRIYILCTNILYNYKYSAQSLILEQLLISIMIYCRNIALNTLKINYKSGKSYYEAVML